MALLSRKIVTLALVSGLIFSLGSCGFHLRGSVNLPESMATTYIQDSVPNSMILPTLRRAFLKNGIVLVASINSVSNDVADADKSTTNPPVAILQLTSEHFDRRLLSTGTSTRIKEYQLNYTITFSLKNQKNETLLPDQTVNVTKEQTFDEAQVLSKTTEQKKLQQEMMRDAVRQMVRRLQSLNASANTSSMDSEK